MAERPVRLAWRLDRSDLPEEPAVIAAVHAGEEGHGDTDGTGLDAELVRKLRIRAAEHGRSAEAGHRGILMRALEGRPRPGPDEVIERLSAIREEMAGRSAGSVAELLAESRRDRMPWLTGSGDGM